MEIHNKDPFKHYFNLKGKNAERSVHELSQRSFLIDWCFPNPVLPNGKELCDLLVIFDQTAIIWQVKDLKIGENGRYKKSEVQKNLRQLSGARRQLFDLKTPIELKNSRRTIETFDPTQIKEIFLISVLLGEGEDFFPFVESIKRYTAHVFNKDFTQIILNELDTISDFITYLRMKEALIKDNKSVMIMGGEEELLAFYLMNERSFSRIESATHILLQERSWIEFINSPSYKAKKEEDKYSYGWDDIINRAHEGSSEYELVARELARPTRFERRFLGKCFLDAWIIATEDDIHDSYRRIIPAKDTTYCFIFCDSDIPRESRISMLKVVCYVARGNFKQNKKALGIATEKKIAPTCSYDFCFLDFPNWTEENEKEILKLQKQFDILKNPVIAKIEEDEYPQKT
jgi:hypothetical protein